MKILVIIFSLATVTYGQQYNRNAYVQFSQNRNYPQPDRAYDQPLQQQQQQTLNRYQQNYYGKPVAILRQYNEILPDGYQYGYDAENGISVAERGQLKNVGGPEGPAIVAQGQYSYTAPDGTPILLQYTADENGFQASGAHLPTPPPIPPEILRGLAHNAAHPEEDDSQSYPVRRY